MEKNLGIIGFGNMGQAIAERLRKKYKIFVFDKDKGKLKKIKGIRLAQDNIDLVNKSEIIILAVKPQDFEGVLNEIKDYVKRKLLISIAAGITTQYIEKRLGKVRIIRTMPNLAIKIGKGLVCLCRGRYAKKKDLDFTKKLFSNLGKTLVMKEDLLDAVTAISGSGPGFFYDLIEGRPLKEINNYLENVFVPTLALCAKAVGFNSQVSQTLAQSTARGSLAFLKKTRLSPAKLKKCVASAGGTTEAGLMVLHRGGSLIQAVRAALRRAGELSRRV
ncbi:MAG: pyrroline-5-carboxylate reductase [Candidatus Omnitrophica bacterium]|nr:pyrroline-5-carboxylate reductase [Candidatus Omnitrophota bacterium]